MVRICKKCGFILDTRPNLKEKDGVCLACINNEKKKEINWKERQLWLTSYIKENITNPEYDCVVACSGGKDSCTIVKRLVENHGVKNPLLVYVTNEFTHTKAGKYNLDNLCKKYDCDLITYRIAPITFRKNVRKGFLEELHPLKWIENKISTIPVQIAKNYGIKLVFYGEDGAFEYGEKEMPDIFRSDSDEKTKIIYLGSIYPYSITDSLQVAKEMGFRDLDYYNEWGREGTIEQYTEIDKIGGHMYVWTKFPKFGFQRVSDIACRFVREGIFTKEQALQCIKEKDYICDRMAKLDFCRTIGITEQEFDDTVDKFANKDLLVKDQLGQWRRKDLL